MAEAGVEEVLAQWMPICDDCDNPVEHYCTTCGDKLCTGCKEQHLSRRRNRDHQVVVIPYSAGVSSAPKSASTCINHPGEKYQMYCNTCQDPVCTRCVTQLHSGHDFISIPEASSVARETAISTLEILTMKIRPRVKDDCEKAGKSEAETLQKIGAVEQEMRSRKKLLHEAVDISFEENMKQLTEFKEQTTIPLLQKQKKDSGDLQRNVEKAIKDYEDCLRSSDPIQLIRFLKGRGSEDLQLVFPEISLDEIPMPRFQAANFSSESMKTQVGAIVLPENQNKTPIEKTTSTGDKGKGKSKDMLKTKPEISDEFSLRTDAFANLYSLRHLGPNKIWISGRGPKIVFVDRVGNVLRTMNVKCQMNDTSGICCTKDGETVFSDRKGKRITKISADHRMTTLFTTDDSRPRGISQLQSGKWVVCMSDEGVLRVYDGAGKVVREMGKGQLQKPYYVTVNKVNDDICVSDNFQQVVVFNSSGKMRFTYTGSGNTITGFDPYDLCCDRLGNILITDCWYHRVHILDRDGRFLQYLVCGKKSISNPATIDVDDKGYAWVGEYLTRTVKVIKYVS